MLNLYQLQSFVTVISEGSMTGAADKLYLTQPAISQQIRNLEEELGLELLVRGVRQIKPTLQGEVLFEYAKRVLQLVHQAEIAVRAMGAELKGQLKVGTLNSIGVHLISSLVARLLKHNPKLNLMIEYNKGPQLISQFKRGELDVLILPDIESEYGDSLEQVDKRFLLKEEIWLVGSGKDTDIPRQIGMGEFGKYPVISLTDEYPKFNERLHSALKESGAKIETVFESSNVGTLKRVIEAGLGWGFLPSVAIRKQVKMGRMTQVHVKDMTYEIEFYYYSRKNAPQKSVVDVFFQALQHQDKG